MTFPLSPALTLLRAEFDLGARLGVNATPALWMPDGNIRLGYLPPNQLAKELGIL